MPREIQHDRPLSVRQSNPELHLVVSAGFGILFFGTVVIVFLSRVKLLPAVPLFVKVRVFWLEL